MTVKLTITMNEQGQLQVEGPIDNRGLCYQMLELARDAIADHTRTKQQRAKNGSGIVIPQMNVQFGKQGRG